VHSHLSGDMTEDFVSVFQDDSEGRIGETLFNESVNLNGLFFTRTRPRVKLLSVYQAHRRL
jgi:hypothetical protein